ncbi:hypothetical protein K457DRAFT_131251 [Linnemannia elongata AG-77]|uniref:Uncharacterized protein n=1 Tax=Linnemannia elongata AG-77 TaxID=1314771 RepID=A0A197JBS2_9FUNG|nr:hypothetical protein K457DRAFT_131251 [Linnemannia elongata AG-77]
MKMGKVIKIEIPLFPTPNGNYEARSQFTVYVKSDKTAEDCKIGRLLSLGSRQKAPCRISWMVDLTENESPSNTSNDDITVSESQGKGRTEVDQDGDVSLEEADLEDFDRDANNINNPSPTNSSDDNDEPMKDAANNSIAARIKARTVFRPAVATTAMTTLKATNKKYTKGGRPINKSTSRTKNSWKK